MVIIRQEETNDFVLQSVPSLPIGVWGLESRVAWIGTGIFRAWREPPVSFVYRHQGLLETYTFYSTL